MYDLNWLLEKLYLLPAIFIGLSFHEFAHALAAYFMGDKTAKEMGRLTVDPRAHIDLLGFIALLVAGFGWAKPVPINPWNFKRRRLGTVIVSLAGPVMNLILAFLTVLIIYISTYVFNYDNEIVLGILIDIFSVNVVLCVFNLIPIPPLDGSKILASFLPGHLEAKMYELERYSYIILIILLATNTLDFVLNPAIKFLAAGIENVVISILTLFGL